MTSDRREQRLHCTQVVMLVLIFLVAPGSLRSATLTEAVDSLGLVWQTGGSAPWFAQSAVTRDGIDAAVTGVITDDEESWLETTVQGPGPLTFWWKVSSELGYDALQFLIDGVEQNNISGEVNWEQRTFALPAGDHVLTWRYVKDESAADGLDRGWLDQVSYSPTGSSAPVILTQPASLSVPVGAVALFSVVASGIPEPTYQWYFNGNIISRGTNRTLTLSNVGTGQAGFYFVVVSNSHGSVTSVSATLAVTLIGDAIEALELPWNLGGDISWFGQSLVTHDHIDAAESGSITNSQQSWIETAVQGPGSIAFWWKASSEAFYDGLQFLTNGSVAASLSGESDWERKLFVLPKGPHLLRWRYFKDGSLSQGQDKGWLDEVTYVSNKPPANLNLSLNLPAIEENGSVTLNGSFTDPDLTDPNLSDPHVVTVSWGDGTGQTITNLPVGVTSFALNHQFRDDDPSSTPFDTINITASVSDDSGSVSATLPLRINNVAPVLTNLAVMRPGFPYDPVIVTADISDVSPRDTLKVSMDWGDNTTPELFDFGAGSTAITLRHTYLATNATLSLTLRLMDDDNGAVTVRTNVFVPSPPIRPRLTSIGLVGRSVQLRLQGTPGANYQIQASEDLRKWTTIAIRTMSATDSIDVEDTDRDLYPRRFYRAIWETQRAGMRLGRILKQPNGRFSIRVIGLPSTQYQLETSTDAVGWSPLGTVKTDTSGVVDYEDSSPIAPRRFYRAVLP